MTKVTTTTVAKGVSKTSAFVKNFVTLAKGDTAEILAQKTFKNAQSALNTHISILKGDLIEKEDAVETAKERLANAKINSGIVISNRDNYIQNLFEYQNKLTEAIDALEAHENKLSFLEEIKDELTSED